MMFYVAAALGPHCRWCARSWPRGETAHGAAGAHLMWLLRRCHSGSVMLLGIVLGISFVLPTTFLPTYTEELGIDRTGVFFAVYASTAFVRLSTRRFPEVFSMSPMIFLGLAALLASLLCYLPVASEWGLMIPGVFAGISHAVLFPSVTAEAHGLS